MGMIKIIPSNDAKPNETSKLCSKIIKECGINVIKINKEMSFGKNNNVNEKYTIVFNDNNDIKHEYDEYDEEYDEDDDEEYSDYFEERGDLF